jgi:catechol 2,3-dioxygenase-like lactoylglutathione lyase family enzyme
LEYCRLKEDRMTVRRIVANLAATDPAPVRAFYEQLLDLEVVMDLGWIVTLASPAPAAPQLSIASEGGSGTLVPDLSIEVDDVDEIFRRALAAKLEIVYGLTDEPWGVRRFYLRDPLGRLVNILSHLG